MDSEISLLSTKEFIEASRDFVCVRLGTLESKEHQDIVRSLLRGTFQNTACVVYAPDGETTLTRSGRSPNHIFPDDKVAGMNAISAKYKRKGEKNDALLGDFHSFKQSLNVSSADQRLLLFTAGDKEQLEKEEAVLTQIFNDEELIGRFHFDQAGAEDGKWQDKIKSAKKDQGHFIIQSGTFGTEGKVLSHLPLTSSKEEIKQTLLKVNAAYAKEETRKVYAEHITEGRKKGVSFENTMPPGEDRDGDGKIDEKPKRRRK